MLHLDISDNFVCIEEEVISFRKSKVAKFIVTFLSEAIKDLKSMLEVLRMSHSVIDFLTRMDDFTQSVGVFPFYGNYASVFDVLLVTDDENRIILDADMNDSRDFELLANKLLESTNISISYYEAVLNNVDDISNIVCKKLVEIIEGTEEEKITHTYVGDFKSHLILDMVQTIANDYAETDMDSAEEAVKAYIEDFKSGSNKDD